MHNTWNTYYVAIYLFFKLNEKGFNYKIHIKNNNFMSRIFQYRIFSDEVNQTASVIFEMNLHVVLHHKMRDKCIS